jgi:hypothetical protein
VAVSCTNAFGGGTRNQHRSEANWNRDDLYAQKAKQSSKRHERSPQIRTTEIEAGSLRLTLRTCRVTCRDSKGSRTYDGGDGGKRIRSRSRVARRPSAVSIGPPTSDAARRGSLSR